MKNVLTKKYNYSNLGKHIKPCVVDLFAYFWSVKYHLAII